MTASPDDADGEPAGLAPAMADAAVAFAILRAPDLAVTYANRAGGSLLDSATPREVAAAVRDAAQRVLRTGEPARHNELPVGDRFLHVVCSPIRTGGEVTGVTAVSVDITEEVQARHRAEDQRQRLSVLDETTTAVTAELDPVREFAALAESVVPGLADACAVYLVDHTQSTSVAAGETLQATRLVCVIDPALEQSPPAPEIRLRLAPTRPLARAARTGEAVLASESLANPQEWGEHWLTRLEPHSLVAVPIGPPEAVRAVVSFAAVGKRPRYEASDIALMREITARVDRAVGHALRLQRTSEVALTLQRGLLSEPPEVDRLQIRVCYRPAGPGLEVGGDWYDAFVTPSGQLSVTVGDVVGHDLYAASTMGQLRSMVQALACQPGTGPAAALTSLNRLSRHLGIGELATVVHGCFQPRPGPAPFRFTWANAGHPPPLLLGPGRAARVLEQPIRPLLGLIDADYREETVDIPVGATLMLYTDGLMEDPQRPTPDAVTELAATARDYASLGIDGLCDRLLATAPARDDIALLAVQVTAPAGSAHRVATATVTVTAGGAPVAGKDVTVAQRDHAFRFGCTGFELVALASDEPAGAQAQRAQRLAEHWFSLFNLATLPFYWGWFEPVRGQPDTDRLRRAAQWFTDRGATVKGHPLAWHTETASWLKELSPEEILRAQVARIRREATGFAGLIDMWDVINEVVIMPIFDKYDNGLTRICRQRGRIPLVRTLFEAAREANPRAVLLLNDFDLSAAYECLIEGLLEAGVGIDALGLQSHMHQGYWGEEKTLAILERFARYGLPLHFTETTILSGHPMPPEIEDLNDYQIPDWPSIPDGEQRQAEEVVRHFRTLVSHPAVAAVTYWGLPDGGWLGAPGGLVRADGAPKPAYHALHQLIRDEWWLPPTTMGTDADGRLTFTGFLGTYELTVGGTTARFRLETPGPAAVAVML